MNILIVGNGFDLSHYLPTKYDHFMDVMGAIEKKNTGEKAKDLSIHTVDEWMKEIDSLFDKRAKESEPNYRMSFDELFSETRDEKFIEKTKEYYLTDEIEVSAKDVLKIQYRLELNCWYQYFKDHTQEVKTWIDFEQKIDEVLTTLANCIIDIERINRSSDLHEYFSHEKKDGFRIKEKDSKVLGFFNFIVNEEFESIGLVPLDGSPIPKYMSERGNINPYFCHGKRIENGFNPQSFTEYLNAQLEEFIEIFNLYLEIIVGQLFQSRMIDIDAEWSYPDKIYSFNYTNTYQQLHDAVDVEYLHGSCGEKQNIVLGVSELEHESLKKIKAYGFTKYQQKLFKDTDYLFLDKYKSEILETKNMIEELKRQTLMSVQSTYIRATQSRLNNKIKSQELNLHFYIWGHSLDVSDKDYIIDLFSLNDDIDRNVRVTVYYFDKSAKFSLLNNLLAILKKDKVEHWMKNKWLQFKENPEVRFLEAEKQEIA